MASFHTAGVLQAKNLINSTGVPTLVGKAVEVLQKEVPNAAVLYSSATGISGAESVLEAVYKRVSVRGG